MMASPVGGAVKDSLKSVVTKFTNTGDDSVTTGNIGMYYAMSLSGAGVGDTIVFDDLPDSRFLILNEKDGYTHVLLISGEQDKSIYSNGAVEDFGGYNALSYAGSTLDTAMETYYNNLPDKIKSKIKQVHITQSAYNSMSLNENPDDNQFVLDHTIYTADLSQSFDGYDTFYIMKDEEIHDIDVGDRYVFAPSVKEIMAYGGNHIPFEKIQSDIFHLENQTGIFLRDSRYRGNGDTISVFAISKTLNNICPVNRTNNLPLHPSFWIDTQGLKYLLNDYVDDIENLRS